MITQLSILSKDVRIQDGMFSLNDLHKAAGSEQKHKPALFLRHQQTQELIEEIEKGTDSYLLAVVTVKGRNGGTYVCKELVHAYAMWISPKFHLYVIRAFDQMINQPKPQQVIGSEGMRTLSALIQGKTSHLTGTAQRSATTRLWNQVHTAFNVCSGMDIPEDQYNNARTFIASYALEGEYLAKAEQQGDEGYYYQAHGRYFADGRAILAELDKYVPGDAKTLLKQMDDVLLCSWTHMDEAVGKLKNITTCLERWRGPRSDVHQTARPIR